MCKLPDRYRQFGFCCIPLPKQQMSERFGTGTKNDGIRNAYLNEFMFWATLTYFSSGALHWMKQLFIIETNFVKNGYSFRMSIFRLYSGLKLSFEHYSARKNLFLFACRCWDAILSLREMDYNFKFGGAIGDEYSYLECIICHYMQYYMMLP